MSATNLSELNLTITGLEDRQKKLLEKRKQIIGNIIDIKKKNGFVFLKFASFQKIKNRYRGNKRSFNNNNINNPDAKNEETDFRNLKKRKLDGEPEDAGGVYKYILLYFAHLISFFGFSLK